MAAAGLAAVLLGALGTAACDMPISVLVGRATDTWTHTYPLTANGQVEITNANGPIDVQATDGSQVEVTADRTIRASSSDAAREALKSLVIKEDASADRVALSVINPPGDQLQVEVAFHVKVPKGAGVRLETRNGPIDVTGVGGHAEAGTINGAIAGRALSGSFDAHTVNGGITADFAQVPPDADGMTLRTTNGAISVALPKTAKVDLSARCSHGGVDMSPDLPMELDVQAPQRFEGHMNGGGTRIIMETVNGGIHVAPLS
jgi:DUF4097 and DUF4098 domain-containing protein YvlB